MAEFICRQLSIFFLLLGILGLVILQPQLAEAEEGKEEVCGMGRRGEKKGEGGRVSLPLSLTLMSNSRGLSKSIHCDPGPSNIGSCCCYLQHDRSYTSNNDSA